MRLPVTVLRLGTRLLVQSGIIMIPVPIPDLPESRGSLPVHRIIPTGIPISDSKFAGGWLNDHRGSSPSPLPVSSHRGFRALSGSPGDGQRSRGHVECTSSRTRTGQSAIRRIIKSPGPLFKLEVLWHTPAASGQQLTQVLTRPGSGVYLPVS